MTRATILGCGYVGSAVAHYWHTQGTEITVTTTTPERLPELEAIAHRAKVIQGDDREALLDLLADQEVVLMSVGAPSRDAYERTYLGTAKTLVSLLPETPVSQVIYTGSCAVYGDQGGEWVTEDTAIAPSNANGKIMAETEQVLLDAATEHCHVCVFRLGGIYGPGREIARIFRGAAGSTRPGDGSEPSNWIHLDDIVGAIAFAQEHHLNGLYNLVHDEPPSRRELVDRVLRQQNLPPVQWDPQQPSQRSYSAKVSNQKLKSAGYTWIHPTLI